MGTELASITLSYVVAPTPANRRALCGVYLAEEPPPNDFLIGPAPAHKLPSLPGKGTLSTFHLRAVRGSARRRPARAWPSFEGLSRDEFVNHHRAPFTSRLSPTVTPTSSGQDLNPMRGEIGGVFKLAHNRAIRRLIEPHDKLGLPALDVGCEFTDSPNHGYDVRRFEFAL